MLAIDLRMLNSSGIGTYIRNLLPYVVDAFPDRKINLLGNARELGSYPWARSEHVELIECRSEIYSLSEQYEMFQKIPKRSLLFWSPHYNIPLMYRGRLLVTVHDAFHLAEPRLVGGLHKHLYAKIMFHALKAKADRIVCDSRFTADELTRLVGVPPYKMKVIHLGVDPSWFEIRKKEGMIEKPYLLFVGNVKPNKNLVRLIEAFEIIMNDIPHDLVIVGKKEGFITADRMVEESARKHRGRIRFTGYVDDATLRQYFAHAKVLVLPSLYEGFGFPPLEAMACGCPVAVANSASLPEVCGKAALYFDPFRPEDIAEKIFRILHDGELRQGLRVSGFEQAKKFTWTQCAHETCLVIRDILN